ncbi:MAG: hypothetical protein MJA30_32380 [Cytophagales bacterium]|nr:hypothetical protein [Cytophagales bacterium]
MRFIILFIFSGALSIHVNGQAWRSVYTNDAYGKPVKGDFQALIQAIEAGKEVRISWNMGSGEQIVKHYAPVQFITIIDSIVYAQITPIIGQKPSFEKKQVTFHENLQWSMIAGSHGKNDTIMRDVISGSILGHNMYRWGTEWFIRD